MNAWPGVLLVEDDASIVRYVELALEDLPLRLRVASSPQAAEQALAAEPVALVITDLSLGADSGLTLLRRLHADPVLRGGARLVVYSASMGAEVRRDLQALGVWRMLAKPVPLATLHGCVREALALAEQDRAARPTMSAPGAARAAALDAFGGDQALFDTYRAGCLARFATDIAVGDRASAGADTAALRRLGHDLRSVLQLIGEPDAAHCAAALEQAALAADAQALAAAWSALRSLLAPLARPAA
jgi:CheY-like chemotaxis protein